MSAPVKAVAKLIKVLLEMYFIESMMRSHDERAKVADVRVNVWENQMSLPFPHWITVMDKTMSFQRWVNGKSICANDSTLLNVFLGEAHNRT